MTGMIQGENYQNNSSGAGWKHAVTGRMWPQLFGFLLAALLLSGQAGAQTERYPASLTTAVTPPYSLYLDDLVEPGSDGLIANIIFNDFDEVSWNFALRLTIESQDIRLQTRPGFRPSSPITAFPGELIQFTGTDWTEYLNYNNLIIEGPSVNEFYEKGRLPEGFYRFTIEVLDYTTGEPLSRVSSAEAWLRLMDPPRLNTPVCGTFVDPKNVQFNFLWQLFNSQSAESQMGTTFQLTIWEMLDNQADPLSAVPNGQALQVFQSGVLSNTTFAYGLTEPLLDVGKRYIYQVQAFDSEGKDVFKNNGYSEYCNFYYGWPEGGNVALMFPEEGGGFRKRDMPYARWKTVDNILPNELVSYHIKVVPIYEGQSREDAIFENDPFYYYESLPTSIVYEPQLRFNKQLTPAQDYVWQVKAYADEQEVGKSEIALFHGPSLVEEFFAGTHLVKVDYLDSKDLKNLSGEGRIRLSADYEAWTDISFENISLELMNGMYVLTGGDIYYTPDAPLDVTITADVTENKDADFSIEQYRVNKNGLKVYGHIEWDFPHATLSDKKQRVISQSEWANFDAFTVSHAFFLEEGNEFTLLDPMGFTLDLDTGSVFYVYENSFDLAFKGDIVMPDKVKGRLNNQNVRYAFADAEDLFYIPVDYASQFNTLTPLNKAALFLNAERYVIDLSETQSPEKLSANPAWKGLFFDKYVVNFERNLDKQAQFTVDPTEFYYEEQLVGDPDAWITGKGLTLHLDETPEEPLNMVFQTFPAAFNRLKLEITDHKVQPGSIMQGDMIVPIIDEKKRFGFESVIAQSGFREGYLTDMEGTSFVYNPEGGDQRMEIDIKRAVLAGNERVVMTIDIDWPGLGIELKSLIGFSAWGDYNIGFDQKNGTLSLVERVNATLGGEFPVTLAVIGAGASDGHYAIGTKADIQLGNDVAGNEKAPEANIFSMIESPFAPTGDGEVATNNTGVDQINFEEASANIEQEYAALADQIADQIASLEGLESGSSQVAASYAVTSSGVDYDSLASASAGTTADSLGMGETTEGYNDQQNTLMQDLVRGFVDESLKLLAQPITDKIDSIQTLVFKRLDSLQGKALGWAETPINETVNFVSEGIVNGVLNNEGAAADLLNAYAEEVKSALNAELRTALNKSVNDNLKIPITKLLQESLKKRLMDHFSEIIYRLIYDRIAGLKRGGGAVEGPPVGDMIKEVPQVFGDVFQDFKAFLAPDSIYNTIQSLAVDFIENIDMDRLVKDLKDRAVELAAQKLQDAAEEVISDLASDIAGDAGLGAFAGGGENPLNFVGIGTKLAQGVSVKEAFFIEPVWVNLNTPVLALNGPIQYIPKHPDYGDVWSGDIELKIKVPKDIEFRAIYINGRKDDLSYWFAQIDPVENRESDKKRQAYEIGKPLPKGAREIKNPVKLGVLNLVAASGRVYKHMSEQPGGYIKPDAEMNYGAFLNLVFYDPATTNPGAKMRLEIKGEVNTKVNGDYTIDFEGNLQMQSETHTILDPDPHAVINGIVTIHYNSAEKHFIGYAKVVLFKPNTLCAEGSLLVDVKPGKWRVAIGSREERLQFVPGCVGWSPTGWLDINQNEAELGLGLQLSAKGKTPKIPLPPFVVRVTAEAGLAFGIMAGIQYRPEFKLLRAGVWAEIWAYVDVEWKLIIKKKWKRKRLIDIYVSGDLTFYFVPKPTKMEGKLKGHVRVAGIGINFKANMEKEL